MPIGLSAKKSWRKSKSNHTANNLLKAKVKTVVKSYLAKPTAEGLKAVFSITDKALKNHLFHKNKVARLKAGYSKKLGKVEPKKTKTTKKGK